MPTITETPVRAYAHCVNPRCSGNAQVEVDAVLVIAAYAYHETGGDGMFSHPERTTETPHFFNDGQKHPGEDEARPDESKCDLCGSNRDLSLTKRMALDNEFGDRGALLDIEPGAQYDPDTAGEVAQRLQAEDREKEIAGLREQMAEMRGIMLGQQSQQPEQTPPESSEADEPED